MLIFSDILFGHGNVLRDAQSVRMAKQLTTAHEDTVRLPMLDTVDRQELLAIVCFDSFCHVTTREDREAKKNPIMGREQQTVNQHRSLLKGGWLHAPPPAASSEEASSSIAVLVILLQAATTEVSARIKLVES